ncbi:MAG: hypothetical protein JWQ88_3567 [Rhodoferax sp.]|nr:hypothetical protein [Rhodoferax sp.]
MTQASPRAIVPPRRRPRLAAALLSLAAITLAGCASQPDRYYTLASPGSAMPVVTPAGAASGPMFIEVAPVAMAERLARPQMVVSQPGGTSAEVKLLEKHRWTSSFESELRDALASQIAGQLGAVDVTKGGRQPGTPAWRIAVQLRQFDAVENTRVDAAFSWTLRRADADRSTACAWSGSEPVGPGIDALAQGARRVTAQASAAMARHVLALQANPAAGCPAA